MGGCLWGPWGWSVARCICLGYCGQAGKRQALDWCYIVDFRFLQRMLSKDIEGLRRRIKAVF